MPPNRPLSTPLKGASRLAARERLARLGDSLRAGPDVPRLGGIAALLIVIFGVLGALRVFTSLPVRGFWLDGEANFPASFSTGLLIAAALVAAALAQREADRTTRRAVAGMAVLFAYMSLDEFVAIHEQFQYATGIPWQAFYVPLILVAGYGWLRVLGRLRALPWASTMWIAGAAAWVIAQLFDLAETEFWLNASPHPDVNAVGYNVLIIFEETLEMAGSTLFGLALLVALRSLDDGSAVLLPRDRAERPD